MGELKAITERGEREEEPRLRGEMKRLGNSRGFGFLKIEEEEGAEGFFELFWLAEKREKDKKVGNIWA